MDKNRERKWYFTACGTSVDMAHNGFSGSVETGDLRLWSLQGKGKLVPASTDGLAFYYTVLDAAEENFTLSADIEVEQWTFSNGQDGFGLMAADAVGVNGEEASFWNNSYMASVTRVEYRYDAAGGAVSDVGGLYSMRLGVGAQEKKGVTPDAIEEGTQVQHFKSTMRTLETTAPASGKEPGTYNIVGAYTNAPEIMCDAAHITSFHLSVRRMNDGYLLSYTDQEGVENSYKYYHGEDGDALTKLDSAHIYAGFFAARNARIRVRNVCLETVRPKEDEPGGERPPVMVTPVCEIRSADVANREEYRLAAYGNADGRLRLSCGETGELIAEEAVRAGVTCRICIRLQRGVNHFLVSFTPDADYRPSKYEILKSHTAIEFPFQVTYSVLEGEEIYISPEGKPDGTGTREDPIELPAAVRGAHPGQKLILQEGRYLLKEPLVIARGMDGAPGAAICLWAQEGCRPVLDFCKSGAGMLVLADYWHFYGFDVTNTAAFHGGVQAAGSHNVFERLGIYRNGSTGFQIGRYQEGNRKEEWPCDNRVVNCTAYLNADPGYTDADGFAAKITVGEGNVFEGCISAYNADDGFDLFAKVERGATGSVLIRNCLAFRNGYVLDGEGKEVHVGLGNGFKLGGSSIACGHRLEDSIAFANGEKGVDANSSPDAHVKNVISYNNDSHNVALYTTDARNTAFTARGVLSVRTEGNVPDRLEPRGMQDMSEIRHESNFYFDGEKSANSEGKQADFSGFVHMDIQKAIHGGIVRGEDGGIRLGGFLETDSPGGSGHFPTFPV